MSVIISLSTIPSRFDKIGPTLQSLLAQNADISDIRLNVPKKYLRFPDYDGHAPQVPDGVTLVRPDQDFGPASKILHCLQDKNLDPDTILLFCDDDRIYDPDWAQNLIDQSVKRPDCAICGSALFVDQYNGQKRVFSANELPRAERYPKYLNIPYKITRFFKIAFQQGLKTAISTKMVKPVFIKSGYVDIFEGFAGVVVKPRFFNDKVFDIAQVAQFQDDIWLSSHIATNNIKIWTRSGQFRPDLSDADGEDPLFKQIFDGANRRELNQRIIDYCQKNLGVWR